MIIRKICNKSFYDYLRRLLHPSFLMTIGINFLSFFSRQTIDDPVITLNCTNINTHTPWHGPLNFGLTGGVVLFSISFSFILSCYQHNNYHHYCFGAFFMNEKLFRIQFQLLTVLELERGSPTLMMMMMINLAKGDIVVVCE